MVRIAVVAAILLLAGFAVWHPAPVSPPLSVASPAPPAHFASRRAHLDAGGKAVVYVAGAVARPGLYTVVAGARVADAIRLAGGLRPDADALAVNLAARVQDGDEIAVVTPGEKAGAASARKTSRSRPTAKRKKALEPAFDSVNVNAADAGTLATVPGIGAALAQRIVLLRETDGEFETLDQLLDVAGMTPARLDRASPYLTI